MSVSAPTPFYTVALCTHNHAAHLEKTLRAFQQVPAPEKPFEFLVIDNASSDDTGKILARRDWRRTDAPTRIVHEERLGVAHARNRAVEEARGEYLLFIDDDESADSDWLRAY